MQALHPDARRPGRGRRRALRRAAGAGSRTRSAVPSSAATRPTTAPRCGRRHGRRCGAARPGARRPRARAATSTPSDCSSTASRDPSLALVPPQRALQLLGTTSTPSTTRCCATSSRRREQGRATHRAAAARRRQRRRRPVRPDRRRQAPRTRRPARRVPSPCSRWRPSGSTTWPATSCWTTMTTGGSGRRSPTRSPTGTADDGRADGPRRTLEAPRRRGAGRSDTPARARGGAARGRRAAPGTRRVVGGPHPGVGAGVVRRCRTAR